MCTFVQAPVVALAALLSRKTRRHINQKSPPFLPPITPLTQGTAVLTVSLFTLRIPKDQLRKRNNKSPANFTLTATTPRQIPSEALPQRAQPANPATRGIPLASSAIHKVPCSFHTRRSGLRILPKSSAEPNCQVIRDQGKEDMTRRIVGLCARIVIVVCFATTMLASFPPLVSSSIAPPRTRFMFLKKIRFRPTIRRFRSIKFSRYVCA